MSNKIAIGVLLIITTAGFGAPSAGFHDALSRFLGIGDRTVLALYDGQLAPPPDNAPDQFTQDSLLFLTDFVPHGRLAANRVPRRYLSQVYGRLVRNLTPGEAVWSDAKVREYEEAQSLLFRSEAVADRMRGYSSAITPSIRADTYYRRVLRGARPGSQEFAFIEEENARIRHALNLFSAGGPRWPAKRVLEAVGKLEAMSVTLYPSAKEIPTSQLWMECDLTSLAGVPCKPVQILRARIQFDFVLEELLTANWWTISSEEMSANQLGKTIADGKVPSGLADNDVALPWIPRELILIRPGPASPVVPPSGFEELNPVGIIAVGVVCEILGPLPTFDSNAFTLKKR